MEVFGSTGHSDAPFKESKQTTTYPAGLKVKLGLLLEPRTWLMDAFSKDRH